MCDAEESCGERDFLCVTESDLAYLASFCHSYENQIEWHRKRVHGELQNYPADDKKEEARGKAHWSQEKAGQNKATRHYFEKKPEPKVSLHNLDGWIWKLGVGITWSHIHSVNCSVPVLGRTCLCFPNLWLELSHRVDVMACSPSSLVHMEVGITLHLLHSLKHHAGGVFSELSRGYVVPWLVHLEAGPSLL